MKTILVIFLFFLSLGNANICLMFELTNQRESYFWKNDIVKTYSNWLKKVVFSI